jgi:hypothetical protein
MGLLIAPGTELANAIPAISMTINTITEKKLLPRMLVPVARPNDQEKQTNMFNVWDITAFQALPALVGSDNANNSG